MPESAFVVRPARTEDLPATAKLAGMMVRMHHEMDPKRFAILSEPIEAGYEQWLAHEMENKRALVLVAVSKKTGAVQGYAYARLEPRDWNLLREACGVLHDLFVAERARRRGVAEALVEEAAAWMKEKRAPRMVLETAAANTMAQAFFQKRGFRPTMIEMARELDGPTE